MIYRAFVLCCMLVACGASEEKRPGQRQKVVQAEQTLAEERSRLQALRDSLPIKIEHNVKQLGVTPQQAEELERGIIKVQKTIVSAAKRNLQAQRALLDSLKKYGP